MTRKEQRQAGHLGIVNTPNVFRAYREIRPGVDVYKLRNTPGPPLPISGKWNGSERTIPNATRIDNDMVGQRQIDIFHTRLESIWHTTRKTPKTPIPQTVCQISRVQFFNMFTIFEHVPP